MARNNNATDVLVRIKSENTLLQAPDETLVIQVARGNTAALEVLYDRYAPSVLGLSVKIIGDQALAEDILQETFWRVWQSAGTYQSQRGSFTSWLFRIARNLAIDAYRRRNVRPQAVVSAQEDDPILDKLADPDVDVAEQAQAMVKQRQVR